MRKIGTVLVGLALALATGCGSSGGDTTGGGGGDTTSGGEYAGAIRSTDTALGEERYGARCAPCHENTAPQLASIGWTPERMRQQIREGSGAMNAIPVSRLSDDEMEAVLAYLQTIGAIEGGGAAEPVTE